MTHTMKLEPISFSMIASGKKTIELRLNDEKRQLVKKDDIIEFVNTADQEEKVNCKVIKLYHFPSFEVLYSKLSLLECGYTAEDVSKASAADMEAYYSLEKQKKYGVVGIEISLL